MGVVIWGVLMMVIKIGSAERVVKGDTSRNILKV